MVEPIAAVTDYAIALECLLFAGLLLRFGWPERLWAAAFGSVAIAAVLGGTYHGFAASLSEIDSYFIWQGTLLALAVASFLMVVAAAWHTRWGWRLGWTALATVKLILLLSLETEVCGFAVQIIDYLGALGIAMILQKTGTAWMASGIAISGVAACFLIIPWSPALRVSPFVGYHLIQMVAIYCIYRSIRKTACDSAIHIKS